jgi:hypothetical protein
MIFLPREYRDANSPGSVNAGLNLENELRIFSQDDGFARDDIGKKPG